VHIEARVFGDMFDLPDVVFPPAAVVDRGAAAVQQFLYDNYSALKILLLIMAGRRRRMRRPPAEVWYLVVVEFL